MIFHALLTSCFCRHSVDTVVIEEPARFGGDGTVLTATIDEVNDVTRWNYTSQSSGLVMRASGRHSNECGRGLTMDIYYTSVGEYNTIIII